MSDPRPILVVDDDADLRNTVAEVLEIEGFAVEVAANGREALAKLEAGTRPSIILLDMMMPVMDGWQFRAEQQQHPEWADIPVVIFSAYGDAGQTAADLGAAGSVMKPMRLDSLIEVVERFAQRD